MTSKSTRDKSITEKNVRKKKCIWRHKPEDMKHMKKAGKAEKETSLQCDCTCITAF